MSTPGIQIQPLPDDVNRTGDGYMEHAFAGTWNIENRTNHEAVTQLGLVHSNARQHWKSIHEFHTKIMRDQTNTPLANLQKSATYARKRQKELEQDAISAFDKAQSFLIAIDAELEKAIAPASHEQQVSSEIRTYAKNLESHEQREQLIQQAVKTKDYRTLRAVASAPAYLSGTNPITHARWRTALLDELKPDMMTSRRNIAQGIELASAAVTGLRRHASDLIDFQKADDLDALAKELEKIK